MSGPDGSGAAGMARREWLGLATAGLFAAGAAAAEPAIPAARAVVTPGRDYGAAIAAIQAYALAELAATGLPGMTIAIADDAGFGSTISLGWADLAARTAVTPDHLFEIGSISKSLAGLWLHGAAARGRLDLAAPISQLLPDVPVPAEPITVLQLLNHTGGLPDMAPLFPRVPDGRLWTGYAPGARFSYSNTGYELLGLLIARIAGRPHPQVLADEVLAPLGMTGAVAHILTDDRPRFATGYAPRQNDRAPLTRVPLAEGPWTQEDMAAGAVAAPATAMIGYLRYVLALGKGRGGVLMPDAAARALLAADVATDDFGGHARYASGFATQRIDGNPVLHHTGGMLLFSSSFHADAGGGVGCFASVNGVLGEYRPRAVTAYAVRVLRAVRQGRPLPPAPDPLAFRRVADRSRFVGRWVTPSRETLEIVATADGLALVADGTRGRLEPMGGAALGTDHPGRARYLLEFEPEQGPFTRAWWGGVPLARDAAPPAMAIPAALRPMIGRYAARDPSVSPLDVVARGDRLAIVGGGPITLRAGGYWSDDKDTGGVGRLRFEAPVNGRISRLQEDGTDLLRID